MSFFLYKPHITGPSNNITTPDIIIDRVVIHTDNTTQLVPSNQLSSQVEIQLTNDPFEATPCYVLVAAGGGVDLIGLVQCGIAADAFEEERDEVGGIFLGERGIHGGEFPHVVGAE